MGRILDSLGFQLPQMNVVSSDPSKLYEGESSLELQKGKTDAARIQNLRNLVGGVSQTAMRIAAPEIKKERAKTEQKGYIAGLEAFQGVEGDTYEERNKSLKEKFQELRKGGEIGLVDDPYFQRGMSKAEGKASITLFDRGVEELYTKLQSNPQDFYDTPDLFETELRRVFDSFYVTLPQNTDIQEGFLSHATPVLEKYKQRYKAEFHEYNRKQYLTNQIDSVGASIFSNNTFSDFIDGETDASVRDVWINFSKKFMNDIRTGEIEEDEIRKYVGDQDPETFLRQAVTNPEVMRAALKKYNFNESVEDIQEIYDELHNFSGSGIGGLGAEPTDIILESVIKQTQNPITAQRIIMSLKSGSGMLKDTNKGKAALQSLHEKAITWARQQETYKSSQRNSLLASQMYQRSEDLAILDADISTFNQILLQNQKSTSPNVPNTPEALGEAFLRRIEFLKDIDREEYSKRLGRIREAMNRANSPASAYNDEKKKEDVTSSIASIANGIQGGGNPNALARSLISTRDILGEATDKAFEGIISQTNSDFFSNPTQESADTFWKTAETIREIDQMGGASYTMGRLYSSESVVSQDPQLIATLLEADDRGVLDSFVGSDSNVRQAIRNISGFTGTPEQLVTTFQAELQTIDAEQRSREKEKLQERELGNFNPNKITLQVTTNGTPKIVGPIGLYQSVGVVKETKPDLYLIDYYTQTFGTIREDYIRKGYGEKEANLQANKDFRDRFNKRTIRDGDYILPWEDDVTHVDFISDESVATTEYLNSINKDKEEQNKGIVSYLEGLEFLSNDLPMADVAKAEMDELETYVDTLLEGELNKNVDPENLIPGYTQPVFDGSIYAKLSSSFVGSTFEGPLREAWEARSVIDPAPLDLDSFNAFVYNIAENYSKDTGVGMVEAVEYTKEQIFKADKNNKLGFSIFDPAYVSKQVFARVQRYKEQNLSLRDKLSPVYTDEFLDDMTVISNLAKRLENHKLDFSNHSLSQENSRITIQPAAPNVFVVINKAGEPLKYTNGSVFTMTREDLGDAVSKQQIRSIPQVWSALGKEINPKKESVTTEEYNQEIKEYFSTFPDNIPLSYFINIYKGYGKFMYQEYQRNK